MSINRKSAGNPSHARHKASRSDDNLSPGTATNTGSAIAKPSTTKRTAKSRHSAWEW